MQKLRGWIPDPGELHFTTKGGVWTDEGFIEHHRNGMGLDMPVKVIVEGGFKKMADYPRPKKNKKGKLVYALPGGGEWSW